MKDCIGLVAGVTGAVVVAGAITSGWWLVAVLMTIAAVRLAEVKQKEETT